MSVPQSWMIFGRNFMLISGSALVIQFRLAPEEFIDGQRLYIRSIAPLSERICHQVKMPLGAVLILLSCVGIAIGQAAAIVVPVLALGVYLILLRYGLFRRRLRKAYAIAILHNFKPSGI
jgi:hypothetical protein